MTFHEPPTILINGKPKAKKHYESSIKDQYKDTLRTPIQPLSSSETFFGEVQQLYKKYNMDLTLQRTNPIFSSSDGEFLQKEGIIKIKPSVTNYDLHLAHETAHAMEHIYGKMGTIDTRFYGGTSTGMGMFLKTVNTSIKEEILKATYIETSDISFQTYANDLSEQFARFVSEMVVHTQKTKEKAPNAFNLFKSKFKPLNNSLPTDITIISVIPNKGYPTNSPHYQFSHKKACGHEISQYGISNFLSLEKLVSKTPKTELIGTHDKNGNIYVSSKVPPKFVQEVAEHEQVEHNLMSLKTWLSDTESQLSSITNIQSAKKLRSQFRAQWQNEYNYVFEQLPENIQEELTAQILAMPVRIQAKVNEYEVD